jgi:ribosome biogenesis protein UTP30
MAPIDNTVNVEKRIVEKAVAALKKHHEIESAKESGDLLVESPALWIQVGLEKLPVHVKSVVKPIAIPIKHSFRKDLAQGICLIVKDPQSNYKKYTDLFPEITKVIGFSKLKAKYATFESKRLLCSSYDMFLADKAILPMLPKVLGKTFFEKKKQPIPVEVDPKSDNISDLKKAVHNYTYMFSNFGSCVSVKAGHLDMSVGELVDNLLSAIPEIVKNIPKKWDNVLNIHIKSAESVALPIYKMIVEETK